MNKKTLFFVLTLAILSFALFLPFAGHGFIHDDFEHLNSVAFQPLRVGLLKATGGLFYAPLAWLSFKANFLFWGPETAFPYALTNLLIHTANVILLFFITEKLWRSDIVAFWTALGFILLFPSNIWAVMWIATRAHLLTAFFYLAGMLAALWLTRAKKNKVLFAVLIVIFAGLSIFSKESGVTLIATIILIFIYEKRTGNLKGKFLPSVIILTAGLLVVFGVYFYLRAYSGAASVSIGSGKWYSYSLSPGIFLSNLGSYGWRTYGILSLIVLAICLSLKLDRKKLDFSLLTKNELLLSLIMFGLMIAPFILLAGRSGIYTYLPGVAGALLLGAAVRSLFQSSDEFRFSSIYSLIPVAVIVIILISFTIGQSQKWVKMAETNTKVLSQIVALEPQMPEKTFVILRYSETDEKNRFPDGLSMSSFSPALQLKFEDSSIYGAIVKQDKEIFLPKILAVKEFAYTVENGEPKIVEINNDTSK
jgi:hypothetical protein